MPLEWTPLYDKLVVKRAPAIDQIKGLAVPDQHQQNQNVGTVVAIGDGRWVQGMMVPLTVQIGDVVVFSKFAGVELEQGDERDLVVLREDEILAIRKQD